MRGGDDEEWIEPRAALVDDVPVLDDDERRATAHATTGLRAKPRERVARMLLPVAVRLEDHRHARPVGGELRDDILDDPRAQRARERAVIVAAQARLGSVTAEEDGHPQLDPSAAVAAARRRRPRRWTRTEEGACREVLDLALAIDGGIGHDRDSLVQVVGEIRTRGGQRRERTIPAERADRLVPGLRRELRHLEIVRLESERRELMLATLRRIVELVGRRRDLPARRRLAPCTRAADIPRRLLGTAASDPLAQAQGGDAARRAVGDERAPQGVLVEEPPSRSCPPKADALARPERIRIADIALEWNEPALAREDVLVRCLDMPQRSQAEPIGGKSSSIASTGVRRSPRTMPRSTASTSCESLPERDSAMRSALASSRRRPMVLISPLCANVANGWTRSKLVLVFVAYRLWPKAIDVAKRGSARSAK